MFSVLDFGLMAADAVRVDAYARAIATHAPGAIVLDLGSGTGLFALLAARAGAERVHAVEDNPAIWLLPELARENGLEDRIVVHATSSLDVTLPERATVLVSDLRGPGPLHRGHLAAIADARTRLLVPDAVVLPMRDTLHAAFVELEPSQRFERGWMAFEDLGLRASATRTSIGNTPLTDRGRGTSASALVTNAAAWGSLDYATAPPREIVEGDVVLTASRRGIAHGIVVWFDATVADGIGYSNAPGHELAYARTILPLDPPLSLAHGDRIATRIAASTDGERWAWEGTIENADGTAKGRFRHNTFLGVPTSKDALLRAASTHRPELGPRGARVAAILAAMDGSRSIAEIAAAIDPDSTSVLDEARELARRYAR